ncbi:MAG: helix-turn-helix transcriptional regulator [Candidatus Obscuribacterales bacterium]|nr:helix-turn-helix transcriptional regulator [Candidatus Obscuribacterales bacterium]
MFNSLSSAQVRMARALLGVSRDDVEAATGIAKQTLLRIENNAVKPRDETLKLLLNYFEGLGIEFQKNDGVARRETNIRRFSGPYAITDLLEDVYETVIKDGSGKICISSCDEEVVGKYYTIRGEQHSVRMARIADKISCRALLKEGDHNHPYTSYVEYRWLPKEYFQPNTFYLYNGKLGLIEYKGNICEVTIIESAQLAVAFRDFFEIVWAQCNPPPSYKKEATE